MIAFFYHDKKQSKKKFKMNNHKYFTMEEMCKSSTAQKLKIKNEPTLLAKRNLDELMTFLDGIREAWGSPVVVSSGYRCAALNKAVGGASNSNHLFGSAADLQPKEGTVKDFFKFVKEYFEKNGIEFDELILEKSGKSEWVHIANSYGNTNFKRMKVLKMTK